jgi:Ca2+-binding RTX toxin-like protein
LSTVLNWGELSSGNWQLSVFDNSGGSVGSLDKWTIKFIGSQVSNDNTYYYTNEFSEASSDQSTRNILTDASGIDTINASAVTGNLTLNLGPSAISTIDGHPLTLAAGTIIENAYGGDGSDSITGNNFANGLMGMRGNDTLIGGKGNDYIDGGLGTDTAVFDGAINNFLISYNRALGTVTITDKRSNGDGIDSLKSVEKLQFTDGTFDLNNPSFTSTPTYGKTPSFLFDSAYYLLKNPDLIPTISISTAFDHYLKYGAAEGKSPNKWFDPIYYANKWSDLKPLNLDAATLFMHYNLYGDRKSVV